MKLEEGLNSVLCRCTGYARGVNAVSNGCSHPAWRNTGSISTRAHSIADNIADVDLLKFYYRKDKSRNPLPPVDLSPSSLPPTKIIGKPQAKVDARKLAAGKPVFTDDFSIPGMLYAALLTIPYAHARLLKIERAKHVCCRGFTRCSPGRIFHVSNIRAPVKVIHSRSLSIRFSRQQSSPCRRSSSRSGRRDHRNAQACSRFN